MSTCNWLDLKSLGSWPTMPKNFLGTGAVIISASKKKNQAALEQKLPAITTMPINWYWTSSFLSVVDWKICPQPPSYLLTNTTVLYKENSHAKEVTDCWHLEICSRWDSPSALQCCTLNRLKRIDFFTLLVDLLLNTWQHHIQQLPGEIILQLVWMMGITCSLGMCPILQARTLHDK